MENIIIMSRHSTNNYVERLRLQAPRGFPERGFIEENTALVADDKESAAVDAGSVASFVSGLTSQNKSDVLNSTLLAQLAANAVADREKETDSWYRKYVEVLENVGWIITGMNFKEYKSNSSSFEMDKVALEVLATVATGSQMAIMTNGLKALKDSDPESKQVEIFNNSGSGGEDGNFQLGTAVEDDGDVAMSLGTYYFKGSVSRSRFLFWTWQSTEINLYFSVQRVLLNSEIYASVRQTVKQKLGDRAVSYVADLPIAG